MTETITALPTPDRWRPTRAGLVGLWRYWDETFTFHRGRLLLRGPNGSGKSMALELLLPFLLDGDTSPTKLTSAAKPRGRLFDRVMTGSSEPSRVGFAWVEFARGGDVFTAGARIRASQSTGRTDVDYFTTSLAVDRDLHLLDANRTPLSRRTLAEAIGDTGRVHDSAEEHRAAVREVLFPGFGADRYESVIGALLALRREKLSQNLDLVKLSEVLSEALPPVDDHDVAAVAEGFERLDRRKLELAALEHDLAEVHQLERHQRDYARAVVAGAASEVRNAETRRDDVTRRERQSKDELEGARARAAEVTDRRREIEERQEAIQVETDALKDSEAYRQGADLAEMRNHARVLRAHAEEAAARAAERHGEHESARAEQADAAGQRHVAADNVEKTGRDLSSAADEVGAAPAVAEAEVAEDPDQSERLLHAWVRARRAAIGEVRDALDGYDEALRQRRFFDERFSADEATVEDRARTLDGAREAATEATEAYAAAVGAWADGCRHLGTERLSAALPVPAHDPRAVTAAVGQVEAEVGSELAVARRQIEDERQAISDERAEAETERSRWARGELADPEAPQWRSDRAGLPGAPLWRLVDVASGVPGADIDGIEAALTATGMLDAWVYPDGGVDLGAGRTDVTLTARPTGSRSLASLLVAAPEAEATYGVTQQVVAAVLASISVESTLQVGSTESEPTNLDQAGEVVFATDGAYRLGSAIGRGPVRPATMLGAVARERHRLARLAELDTRIADLDARRADTDRRWADLHRRRAAIDAEVGSLPSAEPVVESIRAAHEAGARLAEAKDRLEETRRARQAAEEALRSQLRELTALAARHGLPSERPALADIEEALGRFRDVASVWARRRRELLAAVREEQRADRRAIETEMAATRAEAEREEAEREAGEVELRVTTLQSSIGQEYASVLTRIHALEAERKDNARRGRELTGEAETLQLRLGELGGKVEAAALERVAAEEHRDTCHRRLVAALTAFSGDAHLDDPGPLETATGVLAAARTLAGPLETVDADPQTLRRLGERVGERVHAAQSALGARIDFDRELTEDGWWVLRTAANGIRRRVTDLVAALRADLDEGRAELAEEEERLFERTLAGSVRRALADRIRQANALTDAINGQLAEIRTAAGGVQVRLRWEVDPEQPDAVRAARSLLLRDPADLSEGERASLQDFVRARVEQARAELEANAPWEARLRETLDYRSWHRFTLQLAHRDWEGFVPATTRRLQKLSTGERSIALHLPMIASVAAHYAGEQGQPSRCPRLILLDELFAGVDTANRAQLFGTFTAWDLDAVFTSDHEWCQYETLDGIAIHHLHPPTGDEPVTSTRFTWDGHRRRIGPSAA